jgi:hypothetical protein
MPYFISSEASAPCMHSERAFDGWNQICLVGKAGR